MLDPFASARRKIDRADKHIADIDTLVADFQSPEFQSVREDVDTNTGNKILHYRLTEPLVLEDLSMIVGDAIHNLRTALDYAWFVLVKTFVPLAADEYTKFPVYETRESMDARIKGRHIDTVCKDLYDFIHRIKPYRIGGCDSLWILHRLDIADKHILPLSMSRVSAVVDMVLQNEKGTIIAGLTLSTILESSEYAIPVTANFQIKNYGRVAFEVVFGQGLPTENAEVSRTLHKLREITLGVVESMEEFFKAGTS